MDKNKMLRRFDHETRKTQKVIEFFLAKAITDTAVLWHLEHIVVWLEIYRTLFSHQLKLQEPEQVSYDPQRPLDEQYQEARGRMRVFLAKVRADRYQETVTLRSANWRATMEEAVESWIFGHETHHRATALALLRCLLGNAVSLPSIHDLEYMH